MGWTPLNERVSNTRRPAEQQTGMVFAIYLGGPLLLVTAILGILNLVVGR